MSYYSIFKRKATGKFVQIFPLHGISPILTVFRLTLGVFLLYFKRKVTGKIVQIFSLHGISSILTVFRLSLGVLLLYFHEKSHGQNHANFPITWNFADFDCFRVYYRYRTTLFSREKPWAKSCKFSHYMEFHRF